MSSEKLCRETIEQWIESNRGSELPGGCDVDEALRLATEVLKQVDSSVQTANLQWSPEIPDVLHALCRLLRLNSAESSHSGARAVTLYAEVEKISWPPDLFCERGQILASFAFEAWTVCRRDGQFGLMQEFASRCERHVLSQELLRDFLARPLVEWAVEIRTRFLCEPATLLAKVVELERSRNLEPERVSKDAPLLREWLLKGAGGGPREEECGWLASQLVIIQSGALRLLGELNAAKRWTELAAQTLVPHASYDLLRVQNEFSRLSILYDAGELEAALAGVPSLLRTADVFGMKIESLKARFLEANLLKDLDSPLALGRFCDLVHPYRALGDDLYLGLCLVKIADLKAGRGDVVAAMKHLQEAAPFLENAGVAWGLAHLHGTLGEVLRDQGHLNEAIDAYRLSLNTFLRGQFSCRSTYLRIVLAETLILAGRDEEAATELVAALPLIERESLARESVVAVALLREALKGRKTDTAALRVLRKQMDSKRRGGDL